MRPRVPIAMGTPVASPLTLTPAPARPSVCCRTYVASVAKPGDATRTSEDATWPAENQAISDDVVRIALADGGSLSLASDLWARLLVEAYGLGQIYRDSARVEDETRDVDHVWRDSGDSPESPEDRGDGEWAVRTDDEDTKTLAELGQLWRARSLSALPTPMPSWMSEGWKAGSYATLIGLTLERPRGTGPGPWIATAIGDSCLFQVRDDRVIAAFPFTSVEEFPVQPSMIATRARAEGHIVGHARTTRGFWYAGDEFWLMSDAVAAWFLRADHERSLFNKIEQVRRLRATDSAADFAARLAQNDGMQPDDVTVLQLIVER